MPQKGEAVLHQHCLRCGWELSTSTGDVVGQWKEYLEDLLNPTAMSSTEEAEAGDSEVDSSITQAEVTEVVGKILGGILIERAHQRQRLSPHVTLYSPG